MPKQLIDKVRIVRYWLGELSEAETAEFEQECFSEDEQSEWSEIVREGLIDLYLRGKLDGERHIRFMTYFLQDPHHQELVANAKFIMEQAALAPEKLTWAKRFRAWLGLENFVWQFALGATAVVITLVIGSIAGWRLWLRTKTTDGPLVQASPTPVTPAQFPLSDPPPEVGATPVQTPLRHATPTLPKNTSNSPAISSTPTPASKPVANGGGIILAIATLGPITKGVGGNATTVLELTPRTKEVRLTFPAPPTAESYQAEISAQGNSAVAVVWHGKPNPVAGGKAFIQFDSAKLPAEQFPAGVYVLRLNKTDANGKSESIPYRFTVVRK